MKDEKKSKKQLSKEMNDLRTLNQELGVQKKELLESNQFLENVFQTSGDGILVIDDKGCIIRANKSMENILDYPYADIVGKYTFDFASFEDESAKKSKGMLEELYEKGFVKNFESNFLKKDGTLVPTEINITKLLDKQGNYIGAVSSLRDISERKKAEIALQESEENYRELVENANSIILRWRPDGTITFFNEFAQKFFGFDASEIIGKNIIGSIVSEIESTGRDLKQMVADILKDPAKYEQNENENICRDRKRVWVNWTNRAIQDQNGDVIEILSVGTDITKRKKTEHELNQHQSRLKLALEAAMAGTWTWNILTGEVFWDDQMQIIFGFEPGTFPGTYDAWKECVHPEDVGDANKATRNALEKDEKYDFEYRIKANNGGWRTVNAQGVVIKDSHGTPQSMTGMVVDITERNQEEEKLRRSEDNLNRMFEFADNLVCIADLDKGYFIKISPAFTRHLGWSEEEMLSKPILDFIHPNDVKKTACVLKEQMETGNDIIQFENRYKTNEGKFRWFEWSAKPVPEEGITYGAAFDITDRKMAEQELIRLSTAIEQAKETIIIFGTDGIIQYLNPALVKQTQYNRDEFIGKDIANLSKDPSKEINFKKVWETINKGESWTGDILSTRKDGTEFLANVNISPVFDDTGKITCFTSIGRDMTKEQHMEEQLRQAQKMEAIGTLAGGIAHDFNNILGGILGYTELAQDDAVQDSPVQEYLVEILKSTTRAKELVKQILAFSRKSHEERKPVLLHPVIQEATKLLRSTIPTTIEIKQNINDTTGMVNADSTQMHQIIMNLCTNAFHAMQETGGMLEIELSSVVITQESMREYHDISPGPFLELRISDTGTGIDSKIIHKIFDPFFTTKDKEKGTGMGLAVVFGIVKDHGGDIKIDSQLGKGTTFRIMLPQVIAEPDNKEDSSSKVPTGTEHILFVDDEKTLKDLWKRILESLGYTVTAKNSSIEALETFQQSPDTFDMVITDQTMPHMTGYNLAKRILEIKPSANIILCTGYSETLSSEKVETAGIKAIIYKPISRKEIAHKIREVLDKHNH